MGRVVFLLEEKSMKVLLDGLLPRIVPSLDFLCVPHEGKQDLEKSIPRKLRAWREPGVRFVVMRDNDNGDCVALKERLRGLCEEAGRSDVLVRLACQELEAWYLGAPEALAVAFGDARLREIAGKERFRNPDAVVYPARALEELAPGFQKVSGARLMAEHLTETGNRSRSYQVFLEGIRRIAATLAST